MEGHITVLNFTGCTTATVHVISNGSLTIVGEASNKDKLSSTGAEVTVETFGAHCIYSTSNTPIGTVTSGAKAMLDISPTIPRTGGKSGAFCGSTAPWTGNYEVTTPAPLNIDA